MKKFLLYQLKVWYEAIALGIVLALILRYLFGIGG